MTKISSTCCQLHCKLENTLFSLNVSVAEVLLNCILLFLKQIVTLGFFSTVGHIKQTLPFFLQIMNQTIFLGLPQFYIR